MNLVAFCDVTAVWTGEVRAVDAVCLDFSKAFDSVSHDILIDKLRKCWLQEWMVRWVESHLNSGNQRTVICGTESSWSQWCSPKVQYCLTYS